MGMGIGKRGALWLFPAATVPVSRSEFPRLFFSPRHLMVVRFMLDVKEKGWACQKYKTPRILCKVECLVYYRTRQPARIRLLFEHPRSIEAYLIIIFLILIFITFCPSSVVDSQPASCRTGSVKASPCSGQSALAAC